MIDCPTGAFWRGPLLEHRKNKDLACLDKLGRLHLSRTQRLRFYLMYVGKPRLEAAEGRRLDSGASTPINKSESGVATAES